LYQIPDTSIHIVQYGLIKFINKRVGWAYSNSPGVHTTTGGDTNWLTGLTQISNVIPKDFILYQNYPNPFNPRTVISYELSVAGYVTLSVYDIQGKHVIDLVNQKQSAGKYQVDFSGNELSSGVYFYKMTADDRIIDTKKMLLLK